MVMAMAACIDYHSCSKLVRLAFIVIVAQLIYNNVGDLHCAAEDVAVVQFDDWMSSISKTSSPLTVQPKQFNEPSIVDKLLLGSPPAPPPTHPVGRQTLEDSFVSTPLAAPAAAPIYFDSAPAPADSYTYAPIPGVDGVSVTPPSTAAYPSPPATPLSPAAAPIYFEWAPVSSQPDLPLSPDAAPIYFEWAPVSSPPAPPFSPDAAPIYFDWAPVASPPAPPLSPDAAPMYQDYAPTPGIDGRSSSPPSTAAYPSPPAPPPSPPSYLSGVIIVAKDGTGHFQTVQDAVNSIPMSNSQRIVIKIKPGVYVEKVTVNQHWITLKGYGSRITEIQWNDTAASTGTTYNSATVTVNGDHFTAREISFRNTAPAPAGGESGKQAVALRISGDFAAFLNVDFYGYQDTLYDHQGRHYFYRCYIEGSIDFIFGNGRSFYRQCRLNSLASPNGGITAQKRANVTENTGFAFMKCLVTGSGSIYLGRAWGPASRVVYSYTYFDDIILPTGWNDWGDPNRQETIFYGEYKCYGPGSKRDSRALWSQLLTTKQAKPFLHTGFINGELWLTQI